jgi:(p)ppGpp synthase/HD superfamily hydrolase
MIKNKMATLAQEASEFASQIHSFRNLPYAETLPYSFHLQMVVNFANYFRPLLDLNTEDFYEVLIACWCHDTVEDCAINYGKIKGKYGEKVAEYVWAVSGFGRTRKERNDCVKPKIKGNMIHVFIKMCDRLANTTFSKFCDPGSGMYAKYVIEWKEFKDEYFLEELKPMFDYYDKLINLT